MTTSLLAASLVGRVIAVTGAHGFLGQAVVRHLCDAGASVVAIDARPRDDGLPVALRIAPADLTSADDAARAIAAIEATCGAALHGLVNIAGGFVWETVGDKTPATFEAMFRLNVLTAVTMTSAALPLLVAAGDASVVNVAAGAALGASGAGMAAYAASKAGVVKFTESLAAETKAKGLRVNAIAPSIIDTPANRADMPDADFSSWVRGEELAEVIGFLLSPAASGITGAVMPVMGRV
jgi:NAD(P)-dependent dehydrogenase (short-subunit alcohol dehydrogenase family)